MTLSYSETQELIEIILIEKDPLEARHILKERLRFMKRSEPEFCMGVIEHGPDMNYSGDQWFDFFLKVPNKLFPHERRLTNKLSEKQRARLGFD